MPRVFADPTAQLNATKEQRENEKNRENPEANFTSPYRKYRMARKRLRDHSPKDKETKPDSTVSNTLRSKLRFVYSHFVLPTAVSRPAKTPLSQGAGLRLRRECVDHSVHSSSCALHHAVRDVLSGDRRTFRHVPSRANRPRLKAAKANAEREKY